MRKDLILRGLRPNLRTWTRTRFVGRITMRCIWKGGKRWCSGMGITWIVARVTIKLAYKYRPKKTKRNAVAICCSVFSRNAGFLIMFRHNKAWKLSMRNLMNCLLSTKRTIVNKRHKFSPNGTIGAAKRWRSPCKDATFKTSLKFPYPNWSVLMGTDRSRPSTALAPPSWRLWCKYLADCHLGRSDGGWTYSGLRLLVADRECQRHLHQSWRDCSRRSGRTHLALGAAANEEQNLNRPGNKWQDGIY